MAAYVDYPYQQAEERCRKAAGGKHEGGRPYFFVDGYSVVEQEAGESKNRAYDEKAVDAFFVVLGAHYQAAADEANQHVRYGGQGAEQAFGVEFQTYAAHCVGIHMVGAEYLVVDYGYDVGVGECKAVAENQQGRV